MTDGEQATRQSSEKQAVTPSSDKKDSSSLGNALRAVYQDAAGEAVPDEMLDLLSKLKELARCDDTPDRTAKDAEPRCCAAPCSYWR